MQITFSDLEKSQAIEVHIREQVDKLGQFYTSINSFRVALAKLHKHHCWSNHFQVRVDIQTIGHELVVADARLIRVRPTPTCMWRCVTCSRPCAASSKIWCDIKKAM